MFKIFLILLSSLSLALPSILNPTIAEASTSVTFQVTVATDDANQDGTTLDTSSTPAWIGTGQSTTSSYAGFRFNNVNIPRGAIINSAKLQFYSNQDQWNNYSLSIAGDAIGNSPIFTTTNKLSQRTLTTNKVTHSDNTHWLLNTWYLFDEMAPVVQEVTNRSDWNSGNSLSLILKGTGGAWGRKFVKSYNGSTTLAPKLVITYTDSGSTPTPTPIPPTATPTPILTPTPLPTTTLTPTPTAVLTPTSSPTPTLTPTNSPVPTATPTITQGGPVVSNVNVIPGSLNPAGAVILSTTNILSDAKVVYGTTSSYGNTTAAFDTNPRTTVHRVPVAGLQPSTLYHFKVIATNSSGGSSSNDFDHTFTTPAAVTRELWGLGDSITEGVGLSGGQDWPSQMAPMLQRPGRVQNVGLGGTTAAQWRDSLSGVFVDPFANAGSQQNVVMILIGHNDGDNVAAYNAIKAVHDARRALGFQTVAMTVIPGNQFPTTNGLIRANHSSFSDGFVDLAADSRLQNGNNTTYFQDGTHPTAAGQSVIAQLVQPVVDSIFPITPTPTPTPTTAPSPTPTPTLEPTSTPTPTSDPTNNFGLTFDGNDDAVNGPLYPGSTGTQTIETWVKPTSFRSDGGGEVILHDRFEDDTQGWILELKRDPVVNRVSAEFWIFDGTVSGGGDGSNDIVLVNNLVNIASNNWYHLAATYDSSSHLLKLFVNGQSVQKTMPALTTGFKTRMGTFGGGANPLYKTFTGQIDEVRISNNIRYNSNFTPPTTFFTSDSNTLLLYHLDEGSGQNINDSSSNVTLNLGTNSLTEASDPTWSASNVPLAGSGGGPTPTPTSTPTPLPTGTPTPTPTSTPTGSSFIKLNAGLNEDQSHQIIRTNNDQLYTFFPQGQYSSVIKAAWTTTGGLPTSLADFSGSTQFTEVDLPISLDAVYDGTSLIHVFVNLHSGTLLDHPFDLTTNTFKPAVTVSTGLSGISGDYQGTQGISIMLATDQVFHVAYWGAGNHIIYKAFTYDSVGNSFNLTDGPTQLDSAADSYHPSLAISPLDGSITVAWVIGASASGGSIAARTKTGASWGAVQSVNTSAAWTSSNFGIDIDQGPSLLITADGTRHLAYIGNFGSCGMDYGRMHYVKNAGGGWVDQTISTFCSHAPTLATNSSNEIYLLGHGHPANPTCTSMEDLCSNKLNLDGSWTLPQVLVTHSGVDGFDDSVSAKWSVVGWNRSETIEFIFFSTVSGSYSNTNLWYGIL